MVSVPISINAGPAQPSSSKALRAAADFFSLVFHPLLISAYVIAFLIYLHPAAFVGVDPHTKLFRMISTVLFTVFYPAVVIFIAWRLKLIRSIKMDNMQDRIVGFMVTMFFYWWTWNVFRNLPDIPRLRFISPSAPSSPSAEDGCAISFSRSACTPWPQAAFAPFSSSSGCTIHLPPGYIFRSVY